MEGGIHSAEFRAQANAAKGVALREEDALADTSRLLNPCLLRLSQMFVVASKTADGSVHVRAVHVKNPGLAYEVHFDEGAMRYKRVLKACARRSGRKAKIRRLPDGTVYLLVGDYSDHRFQRLELALPMQNMPATEAALCRLQVISLKEAREKTRERAAHMAGLLHSLRGSLS